jgi:hypothetical protein
VRKFILSASAWLLGLSYGTDMLPPVVARPTCLGVERVPGLAIAHLFDNVAVPLHGLQGARTCQN